MSMILLFFILFSLPLSILAHDDQKQIQEIMNKMSPEEKIGQLVMPDTHDNIRQQPNKNMKELLTKYHIGSFIIYDYYDAITTANFTNQLQTWALETKHQLPLFISADLEFGAVQHITDATVFPRLMGIGAINDADAAKQIGIITAKEAKAAGYNWNFSPSVDVNDNPANPVIGVRAFGESIELIIDMSLAMIEGHQENHVIATAKHFPGHGNTNVDPHDGVDIVTYDRKTLDEVHLQPFKAAIEAGVDSIMTSHIIVETIDAELPATLSKKVLTDLLREELSFNGVIVTDAMDMGAITNHYERGEAAVMAINAGADIIIAKGSYEEQIDTIEGLYDAYQSGELSLERIDASVERILAKKIKYNIFENRFVDVDAAKEMIDRTDHKEFAADLAQQSITLLKNENILPFDSQANKKTLVIGPTIYNQNYYIEDISAMVEHTAQGEVDYMIVPDDPTQIDVDHVIDKANDFDQVIVATFSASNLPQGQAQLVNELMETNKPIVAFSLGLPYDIEKYPDVPAYIASYAIERWGSPVPTAWTAAIEVVFGAQPGGKLPVTIGDLYKYGDGLELPPATNNNTKNKGRSIYLILATVLIIFLVTLLIKLFSIIKNNKK